MWSTGAASRRELVALSGLGVRTESGLGFGFELGLCVGAFWGLDLAFRYRVRVLSFWRFRGIVMPVILNGVEILYTYTVVSEEELMMARPGTRLWHSPHLRYGCKSIFYDLIK